MKKKILKINLPEPLPKDFDPLLGRSVSAYLRAISRAEAQNSNPKASGSVFDDPDLDFSYQAPAVEPVIVNAPIIVETNDIIDTQEPNVLEEIAPEVQPSETMDGIAQTAINEAQEENNLSENMTFADEEIVHQTYQKQNEEIIEVEVAENTEIKAEVIEQEEFNSPIIEDFNAPHEFLTDEISIEEETPAGTHYFGENKSEALIDEEPIIEEPIVEEPIIEEPIIEEKIIEENIIEEIKEEKPTKPTIFDEPIFGGAKKETATDEIGVLASIGKIVPKNVNEIGIMAQLGKGLQEIGDEIGFLARSKQPPPKEPDFVGPLASSNKRIIADDEIGILASRPKAEKIVTENEVPSKIEDENIEIAIEEENEIAPIIIETKSINEITQPNDSFEQIQPIEAQPLEAPIIDESINEPIINEPIIEEEIAQPNIEEIKEEKPTIIDDVAQQINEDIKPEIAPIEKTIIEESPQAPPKRKPQSGKKSRRKKVKKPNLLFAISYFTGTFFTGASILLLALTLLAPLGRPFEDVFAPLAILWFFTAIIALFSWIAARAMVGTIVAAIVTLIFGIIIFPNIGVAPKGGNNNRLTIGWANIEGSAKSLNETIKQANENGATIIMLAGANGLTAAPHGWALIEAPKVGDATALAVLSKENWRAVTLPGEPTMARPIDGSMTIIGVNPIDKSATKRQSPEREALINRTANRTGIEDIPVLAIGDFAAPAWDRQMKFFMRTAQVKRIRCGGILGTTQTMGVFGVSFDHAFFRNLTIQKCKIGSRLPQGGHSPLWISVEGH